MLLNTMECALAVPGARVHVTSRDAEVLHLAAERGAAGIPERDIGLNPSLAHALDALRRDCAERPCLILPTDLIQLNAARLTQWVAMQSGSALASDTAGDGTNLLLLAHGLRAVFQPRYGPGSADAHRRMAARAGASLQICAPTWASEDLDTTADLEQSLVMV